MYIRTQSHKYIDRDDHQDGNPKGHVGIEYAHVATHINCRHAYICIYTSTHTHIYIEKDVYQDGNPKGHVGIVGALH